MKIKALTDFNLGSMAANHREGDTVEVSAATGKDLIAAGLAEALEATDEAESDEAEAKEDAGAKARTTKPEAIVLKTK